MITEQMRVRDYLQHMLQAFERIQRYTDNVDEVGFLASEIVQDAVLRNIEIIGEAAHRILKIEPDFAAAHSGVPWDELYTLRNRTAHGYHKVDLELLWRYLQDPLPVHCAQIATLLIQLPR